MSNKINNIIFGKYVQFAKEFVKTYKELNNKKVDYLYVVGYLFQLYSCGHCEEVKT